MQKKVVICLVLIVLLPTALLAWLGQRIAHNERQVLEVQVQGFINTQLSGVDELIKGYFQTVQKDLLESLNQLDLGNESLKKFSVESSQIKQIVIIGADGKRAFPLPGTDLSEAEKKFLQRISAVLENPALMTQGGALAGSGATFSTSRGKIGVKKSISFNTSSSSVNENNEPSEPQFGWYTWHWDAELHHIFWWRDPQRRLIGFELLPAAVLSEIIGRLPATSNDASLASSNTRLTNGSGKIVYEWGQYQPKTGEKSLVMLPLSHPLASWKLEYYAPVLAAGATVNSFGILAAVAVIGLSLMGLALYLYQEHSREVRLAQHRVNFVNQVSHELKTPLTNIRLYAELLETQLEEGWESASSEPEIKARRYLGIITAESQRLSRLIANVLSLGQFQKTQLRLSLQVEKVDEVIKRCIAAFKPALEAKGIAVQLQLHADAFVLLDAQVLEQILNNLISNVEKYAASGAAIHIASTQKSNSSTIDVRDFGPGIATRERSRIFQPFYRSSSLLTDGVSGTGIGLDIARQLARLHGGDVSLQEVSRGACFRVSLHTDPVKDIA